MAAAAIPAMVSNTYIAVLRVRRRSVWIVAMAGVLSGSTLLGSYFLLPEWGIAGAGVGWLIGHAAVAAIAVFHWLIGNARVSNQKCETL